MKGRHCDMKVPVAHRSLFSILSANLSAALIPPSHDMGHSPARRMVHDRSGSYAGRPRASCDCVYGTWRQAPLRGLSLPKSFAFPRRRFFVAPRRRINQYTDLMTALTRISHGCFRIRLKAQKVKAHGRKTVFRSPSIKIKPLDCVMATGSLISGQSAS
jgi:hypothetical protein